MAIGSTLIRAVRRTGKNNKPQLESPSSDSSKTNSSLRKRDSDSEATSFSSSVNSSSSTSGATSSTDRYTNGVKRGNQQKNTLDHKLNSKKPTAFGSIRPSRRPQSLLISSPDDGPVVTNHQSPVEPSIASPEHQKPSVHKFTRSGSLRSLKILRKKNLISSESKSSTVKDSHSKKATFSSILKDTKFTKQVEPQLDKKEFDICSYEHCSLHAHHHHHHEPPLKRFSYLKRCSSKDQKSKKLQIRADDKRFVKKKEVKVTKNVSNEREEKKDVDFSIEFYAKTRPESSFEPNYSRDDVHLADIMFGVDGVKQNEDLNFQMDDQDSSIVKIHGENDGLDENFGFNDDNQMSMWRLIHQHMVSGHIDRQLEDETQSGFNDDDDVNQGRDVQKMFAIKMVREAIEKILLPEEDSSEKNQGDDQNEPNEGANDMFGTKNDKPNGWNYVKKVILMKRFITELESAKNKLDPDTRGHVPMISETETQQEPEPKSEVEIVSLRSRTIREKKHSNEWMFDYALQQVVAELAPTQKRKVALLVKSFEMITPKLEKEVAI